jgi:adenine-specific DNA methylase
MTYDRSRARAIETVSALFEGAHFDLDHYTHHGGRWVSFFHHDGAAADPRALREALEDAHFEIVSDSGLLTSVKVRLDKRGKEAEAEMTARAKKKAEEEAYFAAECEAENRLNARAAFGPGVKVVNIMTGESFRT